MALRKFPVEYLVAPDEGHGFARPVNTMAMFMAAEEFLAKYLGGPGTGKRHARSRHQLTFARETDVRGRETVG